MHVSIELVRFPLPGALTEGIAGANALRNRVERVNWKGVLFFEAPL